jgi:hypothetical protein
VEEFIRSHVKALQASSGARPPRAASCLAVEKLASVSVAAHAGVGAGDLLAFVDGTPAARLDPRLYTHRATKRLYTFFLKARGEQVELATSGIEIGVKLAHTAEAIKALYKPASSSSVDLEKLWEYREYATLLELSTATTRLKGGRETPALLFEGVGLYETGHPDEGMVLVNEYFQKYGRNWTMNFAAIALHYIAQYALRQGNREHGLEVMRRGFDYFAIERTADALGELTGVRPPMDVPKWVGKKYPGDYALPILERGSGTVSLKDTLAGMDREKLLVICLLASYRSNGPYSDFLQRWVNCATWFKPFFHGLHVLTMEAKRYPDREFHYQMEDAAHAAGLPFALLHDADGEAHLPINPDRSPCVLTLDCTGTIVGESDLEAVQLWDMLASVSAG